MVESESVLLQRFASAGDTVAFAEIVRRYAALVYGTCLRVLADADQAADATQETFFELTRKAGEIRGSLAAWLHRVAVGKAVDRIRTDSARRQREQKYVEAGANSDPTWQEVSPQVDAALARLDDRTRELLVHHYLDGRPMTELAEERGVSRATVSRQIDSGLARLRAELQRRGVLVTAAALSSLLTGNAARSAPAVVLQQLGKMALVGARAVPAASPAASVSSALSGGLAAVAKTKVLIVAAVIAAGAGLVTYTTLSSGPAEVTQVSPDDGRRAAPPGSAAPGPAAEPAASQTRAEVEEQLPAAAAAEVAASMTPAPTPGAAGQPPLSPVRTEAVETTDARLDLSTPEATVRSFTRAIASGDADSVMACFLPGGIDYEDMQEILEADPDDPQQRGEYEMKLWLQSLDPQAEMPVASIEQTERGTSVTWQVTFKNDVTMEGHTFHAGDTWELDASLQQSGDSWLIDGL